MEIEYTGKMKCFHSFDDTPSYESYVKTCYHIRGSLDNPKNGKPAFASETTHMYRKNGINHRDGDLPSRIEWKNGKLAREEFYVNGSYMRANKKDPVVISYNEDGTIAKQEWIKDGIVYTTLPEYGFVKKDEHVLVDVGADGKKTKIVTTTYVEE